jgi:DNA polymerase-3 subunit delta
MRLRADSLPGALAKRLLPVYALSGDQPLLLDEAAALIREAALRAGYGERQGFQVETGFNWGTWAASFDSLSLFASRRLIELRLPTGKPGVEGGKTLETWCGNPPADTLLLVHLPRADRAMQASKWFAAIEAEGAVVNLVSPTPEQLPAWIGQRLARHGLEADAETLAFLADRVEGNLLAAHQEVEKLALLLPPGRVDRDAARQAVVDVSRHDASELPEALLKGEVVRYCRIIDGLRAEGEVPLLALWLLTQELRTLHRLALGTEQGESLAGLMRQHRVWDSRQPLVGKALKRLDSTRFGAALQEAARVDRAAKGLLREDAWELLKQLGLALMGKGGLNRFEEAYGY